MVLKIDYQKNVWDTIQKSVSNVFIPCIYF